MLRYIPKPEDLAPVPLSKGRITAYSAIGLAVLGVVTALGALGFVPGRYFSNTSFVSVSGLLAVAIVAHRYSLSHIGDVLDGLSIPMLTSLIGGAAIVIAACFSRGFADDSLARYDAALGFTFPEFAAWLRAHPGLQSAANHIYLAFAPEALLLPFALALLKFRPQFQTFCIAWAMQFVIGVPIFLFYPAVGSFVHFGVPVQNITGFEPLFTTVMGPTIKALQNGTIRDFSQAVGGLITMPSFHASGGVLFLCAGWRLPLVRVPLAALNVLLIGTALTTGAHYLVDVIVGVAMGFACLAIAVRLRELARV